MGPLSDQRVTDDDGEQRRKYELEEQDKSQFKTRAAMALVFGNALGLLKNVLFPDDGTSSQAVAAEATAAPPPHGGVADGAGSSGLFSTLEESDGSVASAKPAPLGASAPARATRSFSPAPADVDKQTSGEIRHPNNDNEALYGAKPGSNIAVFPGAHRGEGGDALGMVRSHAPAGAGGGAPASDEDLPSAGTESEPETGPGFPRPADEARGEDDDQDGSDPQGRPNRPSSVARPVQLPGLFVNQSIIIGLSDLLAHASDPDGDSLMVRDLAASSGTLVDNGNGTWTFTPERDDTSGVAFTYGVTDGQAITPQMAFLDLMARSETDVVATQDADTVVGTQNGDTVVGTSGNGPVSTPADGENVLGRDGDTLIVGGDGADRIVAGAGDEVVYAKAGNDVVFGGLGEDTIFGGTGDDLLFGEDGNDVIVGEDGNDTLSGGPGDDILVGGSGDDQLNGDEGNDILDGGPGSDNIDGGSGNDEVIGGAGADEVLAASGDDLVIATVGDGNDSYDGGADTDTYDLSLTVADAIVDLGSGTAASLETGSDHISDFENVIGGRGNDVIIADDETNVLTGGPGDDTFVFRSASSIGIGAGARDKILDFDVGDKIDLSDIDREFANTFGDTLEDLGFRRFVLISDGDAFTAPGQLRFNYEQFDEREITVVAGNIDTDEDAEFEIELYGYKVLSDDDFSSHDPQETTP